MLHRDEHVLRKRLRMRVTDRNTAQEPIRHLLWGAPSWRLQLTLSINIRLVNPGDMDSFRSAV